MLALLAACVLSAGQGNPPLPPAAPPPPRLRQQLKNGAAILVEPFPKAELAHVVFVASARGVEETRATHGLRHLLEHLVLVGDGDLEPKLETAGGFLTARTTRDALEVAIQVPPDALPVALATVRRLLQPLRTSPESIARELSIMREERALRETPQLHSAAAWATAYGDAALDPFGDLDVMATATPESLEALRLRCFRPGNLVVAVAGPVDAEQVAAQLTDLLAGQPDLGPASLESRPPPQGGTSESEGKGHAVGIPVGRYADPRTAASIAAGLAIASRADQGWFVYTPSSRAGLVLAGSESGSLDAVLALDPTGLFGLGRQLAREWLARQLREPGSSASLRANLLAQGFGNRPETLAENFERMSVPEFVAAFRAFAGNGAVRVVGR